MAGEIMIPDTAIRLRIEREVDASEFGAVEQIRLALPGECDQERRMGSTIQQPSSWRRSISGLEIPSLYG
jgi:hypothetical protein